MGIRKKEYLGVKESAEFKANFLKGRSE